MVLPSLILRLRTRKSCSKYPHAQTPERSLSFAGSIDTPCTFQYLGFALFMTEHSSPDFSTTRIGFTATCALRFFEGVTGRVCKAYPSGFSFQVLSLASSSRHVLVILVSCEIVVVLVAVLDYRIICSKTYYIHHISIIITYLLPQRNIERHHDNEPHNGAPTCDGAVASRMSFGDDRVDDDIYHCTGSKAESIGQYGLSNDDRPCT